MPPKLKRNNSARTDNGSAMPFSDAKIKGAKTVDAECATAHRKGFSKKVYTVACGKGKLPGQNAL